jgi:U3 small nucleolar RNA-associated protein 11
LKKQKIKALQNKAAERNDDEFYFSMVSNKSQGGVKVAKRGESNAGGASGTLGLDVVKLMKTQDVGYLRTVLQKTRKDKERLSEEVVAVATGVKTVPSDKRVVFGEDGEQIQTTETVKGVDSDNGFDMDLDGLDDVEDDSQSEEEDENLTPEERAVKDRQRHALEVKRKKLGALIEQERKLNAALQEVEHQRDKMNGNVGGVNKKGVKFKPRQRKR